MKAQWIDGQGCVVSGTSNTILAATFIYSMVFDLLILLMSMYKLVVGVKGGRSQLMTLLFKDGLMYFFIAYVSFFCLSEILWLTRRTPIASSLTCWRSCSSC